RQRHCRPIRRRRPPRRRRGPHPGPAALHPAQGHFGHQKSAEFKDMIQEFSALDGAILIDKPAGPTSHDVVAAIRRHFGIKKVGHCGTLDPNATGLLIIVLGRGTKLSEKLMADDKVYEGAIKFGETTNSYDADGELIGSLPVPPLNIGELNRMA